MSWLNYYEVCNYLLEFVYVYQTKGFLRLSLYVCFLIVEFYVKNILVVLIIKFCRQLEL